MAELNTKEVHERRHRRIMDRHELESILTNWVHHEIADLKLPGTVRAVDYKLKFEDETEGSLGYKVGTRVIIDVTEALEP